MKNSFICILLLVLVGGYFSMNCVTKKQWQGEYIAVSYTSIEPKEDFMVSSYIVVAYDIRKHDKHSSVIYRFEIMLGDEKTGALEVCDLSHDMGGHLSAEGYEYMLVAGDVESVHEHGHNLPFVTRQIHQMYKSMPDYENVKNDVINVLSSM